MSLKVIAVGKKHEPYLQSGILRFEKRLVSPFDIKWLLIPHSSFEGPRARQEESRSIISKLNKGDYLIVLDEKGQLIDSPSFANMLEQKIVLGTNIVFVIGGAYGVSDELLSIANFKWSISPLVFPHQLVRLLLVEQIYRAQEITRGGQYHHE